jgi:tRNA pseudouridine38-40 synthase
LEIESILIQKYRALIEYDGTAYYGFQRQREEYPTIQGELEQVLDHLARQPITVIGSGRTDSGVHATGQVISFTMSWQHGVDALQRALNANLPDDIVVLQLETADPDFHPRFDARRRAYVYHIYNAPVRSPVKHRYSWHVSRPLDLATMNEAATYLVGTHDFAAFGQPPQGDNSVRHIFRADWQREGQMLRFHIEANAFLYRMVRSLVGSLKLVGDGSWQVADFVAVLASGDRRQSGTVAPAAGLYLVSVWYD